MQNLLKPGWIFIINTLPIVVLFLLYFGQFQIIKTLLDEESIALWKSFGFRLAILGILNFGYGVYLIVKKRNVSVYYGFLALLLYIPFIYMYGVHAGTIIPISIPRWMITGDMFLYVGTFLMPTLAYSLFILIIHFTPEEKEHNAWKSFLPVVLIPLLWYLFSQIILPMWKPAENNFNIHSLLIITIISTLFFLFFLARGIFLLATGKAEKWKKYQLAWKIPLSIILPLIGLAVNNGFLFNNFKIDNSGVFGNFSNHWFYILAIINGLLICLPAFKDKIFRFLLFTGRSITFTYTLYFFFVFLPFLPLSVIAIIAAGAGFLMLTPLILIIIHLNELSKDFNYLKTLFSKRILLATVLTGFIVIPLIITTTYLSNRHTLNKALDYLYNPDYSKSYNINKVSLKNTLNEIKYHKRDNRDMILGSHIPYLSPYFNYLVLDNLTLSDAKISTIENIFFGKVTHETNSENIQNADVSITNISNSTFFDKSQDAWISTVDIEITNRSNNNQFTEYATTIELPEGLWISDYYLYIGDRKEKGILAEKKSAMWVFSNIRNENKDPGILYYLSGNKAAFRVFPFAPEEVRKTGIEFIHKEPVKFTIDGNTVELGDSLHRAERIFENKYALYISSEEKRNLKIVKRKPYFHFIVDNTSKENAGSFTVRLEALAKQYPALSANAMVSLVNTYVTTVSYNNWEQVFQNQNTEGGFYVDRAIKTILFDSYKLQADTYPVPVIITDNINNAVFDKDYSDWNFSFPETDIFYNLTENGTLEPHSLISKPYKALQDSIDISFDHSVLEYRLKDNTIKYLAFNNKPSIILKQDIFIADESEIHEKDWSTALTIHACYISQILHPTTSNKVWQKLVKFSFKSKIMTPFTSYIAVENEAQKAILKKKQEQILSGGKSLDPDEDTQQMSEPNIILLAVLSGLLLLFFRIKRRYSN